MAAVIKTPARAETGNLLDRAGICVSMVCLVQCIALSLTIMLAPFASLGFLGSDLFHRILLLIIAPVSLAAFGLGYRLHRDRTVLLLGAVGLAFLFAAALLEASGIPPLAASLLTSIGGLTLIFAHFRNQRARRSACLRPRV